MQNNQKFGIVGVESERQPDLKVLCLGSQKMRRLTGKQTQHNSVGGGCRGKPEATDGCHQGSKSTTKVPNPYLSICRGPIRDSDRPLFPTVTRAVFSVLSLGREGNVGFPGLEGTIHGRVGAPTRGFETASSYQLLQHFGWSPKLSDVQGWSRLSGSRAPLPRAIHLPVQISQLPRRAWAPWALVAPRPPDLWAPGSLTPR